MFENGIPKDEFQPRQGSGLFPAGRYAGEIVGLVETLEGKNGWTAAKVTFTNAANLKTGEEQAGAVDKSITITCDNQQAVEIGVKEMTQLFYAAGQAEESGDSIMPVQFESAEDASAAISSQLAGARVGFTVRHKQRERKNPQTGKKEVQRKDDGTPWIDVEVSQVFSLADYEAQQAAQGAGATAN